MLFDFGDDIRRVDLSGKLLHFGIPCHIESVMSAERLQHLQHLGVFAFGQQIDLQIEVGPRFRLAAASVLAHEKEQNQEGRFQRNCCREKRVREGIEWLDGIGRDPEPKPEAVYDYAPRPPGLYSDGIANAFEARAITQAFGFECADCPDALFGRR